LALLKFGGGNDYLLAGDDYLPALPWFDNADLNKRTELTIMKIERTAVIAALSVIVGLGIVGISPAFAGSSCTTIGDSTFCTGDNGSNSSTTYIGESSFTTGTDRYGNFYSESCTTIGDSTICS